MSKVVSNELNMVKYISKELFPAARKSKTADSGLRGNGSSRFIRDAMELIAPISVCALLLAYFLHNASAESYAALLM